MSRRLLVSVLLIVSVSIFAVAQSKSAADDTYIVNPEASLYGLSGLWKVISAEGTPAKSFGTTGWYDRISRNPGQLSITSTGTSAFYSFSNRLELGIMVNVNEKVLARRIDQLSLGQATLNGNGYAGCIGCPTPIGPPVAMPGYSINQLRSPLTNLLTGRAGYYPLLPWVNRRTQAGTGGVIASAKINIYSERRGDSASFAIHPWLSIPTHYESTPLINTGGQYGKFIGGIDALFSKNLGEVGFNVNLGYEYLPALKFGGAPLLPGTSMIPFSVGFNVPRSRHLQMIVEMNSENYINQAVPSNYSGASSEIDGIIGVRWYPKKWSFMALGAGYRHTLNEWGGDKNGFTFQLATSNLPAPKGMPPIPVKPTATCSATPSRVRAGTPVRLAAVGCASCQLTYKWSSAQGRIEGEGPDVRLDTTGMMPGDYEATVRVSDQTQYTDCTAKYAIEAPPPQHPPTATCSVDRGMLRTGEAATFSVNAASADNRPLTYAWTISGGGKLTGANGKSARFDTTGLGAGTYTASLRVTDDRGLSATCSASTTVAAPPPPAEVKLLNTCTFTSKGAKLKPARVDNACKAVLDDVALRMQSEGDASMVLVGNTDPKELKTKAQQKANANLAAQRAANIKEYLVTEKGLAANRLEVRSAMGGPAKVDMYLVPRGASYMGSGATVTEPKGQPRDPAKKKPAAKKKAATPPADAPK